MKKNLCLMTDSYKFSHYKQYPENTTFVYDYMESRGGRYEQTVFFGLQYFLKEYLTKRITKEDVEIAKKLIDLHIGPGLFNYDGWMHIVNYHDGKLPIEIKAVKEGTVVPVRNILMSIINTDPKCYWLTGYVETLLMKIWAPITVATTSFRCKQIIKKYLIETDGSADGLLFKLHDFGYRGVSSEESAAVNGMAHLVNFMGTDTVAGIVCALEYYSKTNNKTKTSIESLFADNQTYMPGYSIPASEHSTMTALGKEGEYKQMERFLDVYSSSPVKACVSDSYDIFKAIEFWGTMKQKIIDQGTVLVVRPDSGDPVEMSLKCAELLDKEFGHTMTQNSYKKLNNVAIIYGDGIDDPNVIEKILANAKKNGYAASNFAFGMGGGLLQKNNRDTQKFAIKCSAITVNGETLEVYKEPITDAVKISKRGFLDLVKDGATDYLTIKRETYGNYDDSCLEIVYRNGELLIEYDFEEIRNTLNHFI